MGFTTYETEILNRLKTLNESGQALDVVTTGLVQKVSDCIGTLRNGLESTMSENEMKQAI
jgi:hypothetical protein